MALLENIKTALLNWGTKSGGMPVMSTTGNRYVAPDRRGFEQQARAYLNQVVLACIATRAQTLNEPPLVAVDPVSKEIIPAHPLTRLFRRPNKDMSQSMFWQYVSTYIDIGGNAYIHKVRNVFGQVIELRPYHSGHIVPVSESGEWVDYYLYQFDGVTKEIDPRDIIHMRSYYIDPLNPVLGISPIRAAGINIDTYNELMQTLYSYLRNNGVPSGVLSVNQTINQTQAESLKEQFQVNTTGRNRGKPVVLPAGMSYTQMGLDVSKLEASSQFAQYEVAICGVYRVDPAVAMTMAGLQSSTYNNKKEAYNEYTLLTRVPTWNTWAEQVELSFSNEFPEVDVEFDTSSVAALQANAEMINTITSQFTSNLVTVNEARQKLGYPALELDGDKFSYEMAAPAMGGFLSNESSDIKQYETIDFDPPEGVRAEAEKGLEWRREYGRGGTEVGVARARDLSNGRTISPDTARRMKAYFDRHESDKEGQGWSPGQDGFPSAGRIAWALWGGDPGQVWANKLVRQMNSEDETEGRASEVPSTDAVAVTSTSEVPATEQVTVKTGAKRDNSQPLPTSGKIDQTNDLKAAAYWRTMDQTVRDYSASLEKFALDLLADVSDVIVNDAAKSGTKGYQYKQNDPRISLLIERYMKATGTWRDRLLQEITKLAVTEVGGDLANVQSYLDKLVAKVTNDMAAKISDSVGTIQKEVQETVRSMPGATQADLEKKLRDKFETLAPSRAALIAQTTAKAAASEAATSSWSEMNKEEEDPLEKVVKVWTTRRDKKVRESHKEMDGMWVEMGGKFNNGLFAPGLGGDEPGDFMRCRCELRPVRYKNIGKQAVDTRPQE